MSTVASIQRVGCTERDVAVLRALGHPVRLEMMRQIAERPETCACDFTKVFSVSQPTVSQHLKVLRDADLVRTRRRGNQICYSVNPASISQLGDIVQTLSVTVVSADATGTDTAR
jgi:DNA-binding transcriptional ArsR family regulator